MLWIAGGILAIQAFVSYGSIGKIGADSHAYWMTGQPGPLYAAVPSTVDAFLYSPAFAQVISPLTMLPWPLFCAVWMVSEVGSFVWLFRPLGWRWVGPLTLVCAAEFTIGNIVPFLAIAAVVGLRWPGWWAVVALTKPTMALGPVWFAARGQWRQVFTSAVVTLAVFATSFAFAPKAWGQWVSFLLDNGSAQSGARGLLPRSLVAVLATVIAARLGKPWMLAPALLLATPVTAGAASLSILAALPRLLKAARFVAPARSSSWDGG